MVMCRHRAERIFARKHQRLSVGIHRLIDDVHVGENDKDVAQLVLSRLTKEVGHYRCLLAGTDRTIARIESFANVRVSPQFVIDPLADVVAWTALGGATPP